MAEQWLSIVEYARTFELSDMTVRRRIKNGKIKAVLREGKYYIPVMSDKLMASHPSPNPRPQQAQRPEPRMPAPEPRRAPKPVTAPIVQPNYIEPRMMSHESYQEPHQPVSQPVHYSTMPDALIRGVSNNEHTLVVSQQLLNFCHNALKRQDTLEKQIEQKYAARLSALESTLQARDAQLVNLKQQIEDLQLLVKVFEKRQASDL